MTCRRAIASCLLVLAVAYGIPAADTVPEIGLLASAARRVQELLQSGQSEDECKALANSTIADTNLAVGSTQAILDALDKGEECESLGEDAVSAAREDLDNRKSEAEAAAAALVDATNARVQLQPRRHSLLKTGDCHWIKQDPGYTAALASYQAAVEADAEAKAAVVSSEENLERTIAEAARLEHECECRVQTTQATEWEKANANNEETEQVWLQAHNMLCVLEHTTYADCVVPTTPGLTQPELPAGVAEAVCEQPEEQGSDLQVGFIDDGGW